MPLFDELNVELAKDVTIYPYKSIDDDKWPMTINEGKEVPAVPFGWRQVGFTVERPDIHRIKFIESKSAKLKAIKGMDTPYRDFDPEFIKHVTGVGNRKALIKGWVGVETENKETGEPEPKPYDADWLCDKMEKGTFLYTQFMLEYNKLMEVVKKDEEKEKDKDENF